MKFSLFYPVSLGSPDTKPLGSGLLGLDAGLYGRAVAELREQAVRADETGWTSLMMAEHHFEVEGYHVTPNPLLLNVHLAAHTKRLRHGQMGLVLPNWNPLRLAEDIAVADHLTGGRLDIGLSRGYQARSVGVLAQHVGASSAGAEATDARNRRVFEEWFDVMRRSWTEDLWSREGEFIQVPPAGLPWAHPISTRLGAGVADGQVAQLATVPKPVQLPHPPVFTTVTKSAASIEWAAKVGSSIVTLATGDDVVHGIFQSYADAAAKHGRTVRPGEYRPEGGVALCRLVAVAETHEEAWESARQSLAFMGDWLGEFGFFEAWRLPGQEGPVPRTLEQLVEAGMLLVGTPDEVGEQVQRLQDEFGLEYLVFIACAGAVEHRRMLDTIGLFGEHVIPAFQPVPVA
ncbi:LLM class flavin-dependent oxidoreductase [Amycolatopsis sp. NPDC051903]|uniref:LLM class flavin-dependent oxidoreductase n=1 Tax=Amycolatopsis sp. NPDC051903 TaxID=3363936 RepID=UPI0037BA7054